ncbi:pseudouridine synthase [Aquabacterium sp. UBA2148]|uniref:pseudouridine synthase n=1 Tax=Aquabacterium sp. UBA2148 TaxID=1946042 RepID=UPI0025809CF7|nr:pseudouridine synthase [Aquabacterium sp. UBA2148]
MTERKKISLSRPAATGDATSAHKPPVRGSGSAPRKRMTASEAEQARVERAEREARGDRRPHPRQDGPTSRHADDRRANPGPRGDGPRRDDRPSRGPRPDGLADGRPVGRTGARPDPRPDTPVHHERQRFQAEPRAAEAPMAPRQPAYQRPVEDDGRVRLSKLMSERGMASRREADEWIAAGWVRVDGELIAELGLRVLPDVTIDIDPQAHQQQAQRVTILLHKPIGYVSAQAEDGHEPAITLITPDNRWSDDKLPIKLNRAHLRNLAPAGRLDIDSTGLLVLTQDGRIAKALIGEDSGVEKEYLVRVQNVAQPEAENVQAATPEEAIALMRHGLELDGKQLKHAQVSWQNEQQLRVVLREGRKRQIRRMCELVGLKVVGLKRVRMGRVVLGKLPAGQWRFLRPDERF